MDMYSNRSGMKLNLLPPKRSIFEDTSFKFARNAGLGLIALSAVTYGLSAGTRANDGKAISLEQIPGLEGKVTASVILSGTGSKILPEYSVEKLTLHFIAPGEYTLQLVKPLSTGESSRISSLNAMWTKTISAKNGSETVELSGKDSIGLHDFIEIHYNKGNETNLPSIFFRLDGR